MPNSIHQKYAAFFQVLYLLWNMHSSGAIKHGVFFTCQWETLYMDGWIYGVWSDNAIGHAVLKIWHQKCLITAGHSAWLNMCLGEVKWLNPFYYSTWINGFGILLIYLNSSQFVRCLVWVSIAVRSFQPLDAIQSTCIRKIWFQC